MATILSIAQERSQIDSFTEIADAVTQLETLNETTKASFRPMTFV